MLQNNANAFNVTILKTATMDANFTFRVQPSPAKPDPQHKQPETGSAISNEIITGVVAGSVIFALIAIVCIFYYYRTKSDATPDQLIVEFTEIYRDTDIWGARTQGINTNNRISSIGRERDTIGAGYLPQHTTLTQQDITNLNSY